MSTTDNSVRSESLEEHFSISYLLRVWAERSSESPQGLTWRYSLKDLSTKSQRGFADLDSLLAYLEKSETVMNTPRK